MNIGDRKRKILSAVIEEYIRTGEPVGSKSVLNRLNMNVSSATIRNDMAVLEKDGYLEQPHTSAGRIPTYCGYRYYIDNLMDPDPLTMEECQLIDNLLIHDGLTVNSVVENAIDVLEELTNLTVISKSNLPTFSIITRVEVIPAGRRLYALLVITSTGRIKNKICRMEFDLTYEQLDFFAKFINENLAGITVDSITPDMLEQISLALGAYTVSLSPLLQAVYELSEEISKVDVSVKGEKNMFISNSFKADEVATFLTKRDVLDSLLSDAFDGLQIVFGNENNSFSVTNSSLIMSPYMIEGQVGGSLGVIGPARLDYKKLIPNIQYITESVTRLLTEIVDDDKREED